MTNTRTPSGQREGPSGTGLALLVIATAQLMLVLDDSIANIALPSIQRELDIPAATLSWIINAYILAFGGLLLFGGRLGDVLGRRRVLQVGMAIFTLASFLAGLANSGHGLIGWRALQGVGAAMTAPNVLALIATTFPEGKKRDGAMAVYGAMSGLGLVAGLLLGGTLTALVGWRWVFFINVPIGLLVLLGSRSLKEAQLHEGALDVAGAVTSVFGMTALIFGITHGGEHGWLDAMTLAAFALALSLLVAFVLLQKRGKDPLLPLRLLNSRQRSGAYGAALLLGFGPMGTLFLMTLYMQEVLRYDALKTGLAWLPFGLGIVAGAIITSKVVSKLSPRVLAVWGAITASGSMFWLSMLGQSVHYASHVMPAMFGVAFGFVMAILSVTLMAVQSVRAQDSGIASALLNASQQIGVALGLAILSTISVSVTNERMPNALENLRQGWQAPDMDAVRAASDALVHGYSVALVFGAIAVALAALVALFSNQASRGAR